MKIVKEIEIKRQPFLGGDTWNLTGLTPITLIFGKNGSGKSILLRAWRDQDPSSVHYVTPERGGNIEFDPGQIVRQQTAKTRSQDSQHNQSLNYRQQVFARIQVFLAKMGNFRKDPIPVKVQELEELCNLLLPDFFLSILSEQPGFSLSRSPDRKVIADKNELTNLSSGEAQILSLGIDILTILATWELEDQDERILLIDEPDAHTHPDLQARFADFISKVVIRFECQIVIATHSTALLAALGQYSGEKSSIIYLDRIREAFEAKPYTSALRELSACLGGHVLMGPMFGAPILLVEGDDDYRIWSQVPRHHCINISVIPCEGENIKSYQKTLEQIFSSLCEKKDTPLGYALLDGDKPLPKKTKYNKQDYVKYIRLRCHEAENLYLTDEVLRDLGINWSEACKKIVSEKNEFGNKKNRLASAVKLDRKDGDFKSVIKEIARILDPKSIDWTVRVGQRIGRERPEGQLAEFLGNAVIRSLWGEQLRS